MEFHTYKCMLNTSTDKIVTMRLNGKIRLRVERLFFVGTRVRTLLSTASLLIVTKISPPKKLFTEQQRLGKSNVCAVLVHKISSKKLLPCQSKKFSLNFLSHHIFLIWLGCMLCIVTDMKHKKFIFVENLHRDNFFIPFFLLSVGHYYLSSVCERRELRWKKSSKGSDESERKIENFGPEHSIREKFVNRLK